MKCKECNIMMMKYFDQTLTKDDEKLMNSHIESCPHCHSEFDVLEKAFATLEMLPQIDADDNFELDVMKKITLMKELKTETTENFKKAFFGAISFISLLLFSSLILFLSDASILELISRGVKSLYGLVEMARHVQFIYDVISVFYSQSILVIIDTMVSVLILIGLGISFVIIRKLLNNNLIIEKVKE